MVGYPARSTIRTVWRGWIGKVVCGKVDKQPRHNLPPDLHSRGTTVTRQVI